MQSCKRLSSPHRLTIDFAAHPFSFSDTPMPTLRDIADRARVNPSTVSRVFNNTSTARISDATRARVMKIAEELGYRGNHQARVLQSGKTGMVGLVIPETAGPIFAKHQQNIELGLEAAGLRPLLTHTGWSAAREREHLDLLRQGMVDGLICLFGYSENLETYREIRRVGLPLMLRLKHTHDIKDEPGTVAIDFPHGIRQLTLHLLEQGARRIAVVGGGLARTLRDGLHAAAEAGAFTAAMQEHGLEPDPDLMFPVRPDMQDHLVMSDQLIDWLDERRGRIDAILVPSHNDLLGIWRAVRTLGLRVPEDLLMAAAGESDSTRLWQPAITAWRSPIAEVCSALVGGLVSQLAPPHTPPPAVAFAGELIIRESSCR